MRRRTFQTWQDRVSWLLIALGLVLLLLPVPLKHTLTMPLQTLLLAPLRGVVHLRTVLSGLQAENRRLTRLAAELTVENARLRTISRQAEARVGNLDLLRAPVIARDLTTLERYFVVSRGTRHQVAIGTPAVAPRGVIGKVVAVGRHQSLVQTFLDQDSRIAVTNRRSRIPALARPGARHLLELDYVPRESDFQPGDTIVTAGLGGIFPRGLMVGVVVSASDRPAQLFKSVRVRPFVDLAGLEQVFLVGIPATMDEANDDWLDNVGPRELPIPGEDTR